MLLLYQNAGLLVKKFLRTFYELNECILIDCLIDILSIGSGSIHEHAHV
jgi:hypothetical protein